MENVLSYTEMCVILTSVFVEFRALYAVAGISPR